MLQFVLVRMQLKLGILFGFFVWWGGCFLGGSFSVLCCLCYLVFLVVFFFFCNKGGRNYFLHDILLCF